VLDRARTVALRRAVATADAFSPWLNVYVCLLSAYEKEIIR